MTKGELLDILDGEHEDTIILLDNGPRLRHIDADYAMAPVGDQVCSVLILTAGPVAS